MSWNLHLMHVIFFTWHLTGSNSSPKDSLLISKERLATEKKNTWATVNETPPVLRSIGSAEVYPPNVRTITQTSDFCWTSVHRSQSWVSEMEQLWLFDVIMWACCKKQPIDIVSQNNFYDSWWKIFVPSVAKNMHNELVLFTCKWVGFRLMWKNLIPENSQIQGRSSCLLPRLCTMDFSYSPLVQHLLTSW